jgi:outer membrane lipoprotein LolB
MHRATTCLALLLVFAGCASQAPRPETSWNLHQASLTALEDWSFSGKLAVRTASGADTASLRWRQRQNELELTVSGPVGFKQATLLRENNQLSLLQNGERRLLAPGEDPLLREFGWSLPLELMPWWLRGLPAPGRPARRDIDGGRLRLLEQAGWTLEYTDYQWVDGRQLPRVIRFARDDVNGKILLKKWTLKL